MVAWLAAGVEGLNDEHAAATAGQGWASGRAPPLDRFRPPLPPQALPVPGVGALARSSRRDLRWRASHSGGCDGGLAVAHADERGLQH